MQTRNVVGVNGAAVAIYRRGQRRVNAEIRNANAEPFVVYAKVDRLILHCPSI